MKTDRPLTSKDFFVMDIKIEVPPQIWQKGVAEGLKWIDMELSTWRKIAEDTLQNALEDGKH